MKRQFIFMLIGILLLSACNGLEENINASAPKADHDRMSTLITLDDAFSDLETLLSDLDDAYAYSRGETKRRVIERSYSVNITGPSKSRTEDNDSIIIYIFNFKDNQGYAIMSGDERLPSLIALAEDGSLNEEDVIDNPGLIIFLGGLDSLGKLPDEEGGGNSGGPIGSIEDDGNSGKSGYTEYGDWINIVYFQNGLCPVKWDQDDPYNNYCPEKNGQRTVTGCTATAVAQLMAVYKYPNSYNGYLFNWDTMTFFPHANLVSSEAQDNIARLMQQLGLKSNLDVSYGVIESYAESKNAIRTLKAFGYSNGGQLKRYDTQTVISDLKQGYPVLIRGNSFKKEYKLFNLFKIYTKYSGGHIWLAHGLLERKREVRLYNALGSLISTRYESEWYPQCNWGWGGNADGYYLSKAFSAINGPEYPDTETTLESADINSGETKNYQYNLEAITGIRK